MISVERHAPMFENDVGNDGPVCLVLQVPSLHDLNQSITDAIRELLIHAWVCAISVTDEQEAGVKFDILQGHLRWVVQKLRPSQNSL